MDAFVDESLEPIDVSYFFGDSAVAVPLDPVLYPDAETISRSTIEHDWGEHTADLVSMWSRVKGNTMNLSTVIILGVCAVIVIAVIVLRTLKARSRRSGGRRGNNYRKRR